MASREIINSLEFIWRIKFYPNYSPGELTRILKQLTGEKINLVLPFRQNLQGKPFGNIWAINNKPEAYFHDKKCIQLCSLVELEDLFTCNIVFMRLYHLSNTCEIIKYNNVTCKQQNRLYAFLEFMLFIEVWLSVCGGQCLDMFMNACICVVHVGEGGYGYGNGHIGRYKVHLRCLL